MRKYKPKHHLKVGGKMNESDAGIVGRKLADAAFIFACCGGASALIFAVGYCLK